MREQFLQSPRLGGLGRRASGAPNPLVAYASANGALPTVAVHDLRRGLAFTGPTEVALGDVFSYANTAGSPLAMVDNDAVTKFQPHNLQVASEDFGSAVWGKINVTVASNATTDPDGGAGADKIAETVGTVLHYAQDAVAVSGPSTLGVFLKQAERDWGQLKRSGAAAWLEFGTGTIGLSGLDNPDVADYGGGWYKLTGETSVASYILRVGPAPGNGVTTYEGIAGHGIYAWGAFIHLQGMVDNPERGDEYVPNPSTTAPAFLPRLGHHADLGSGYQRAGLLFDSANETYSVTNVPDGSYDIEIVEADGTVTRRINEAVSGGYSLDVDGAIAEIRFFDANTTGSGNLIAESAAAFDTSAGWIVPPSWTISGGVATHSVAGASEVLEYPVAIPAGHALVTYEIVSTNDTGGIIAGLGNAEYSTGVVTNRVRNYAHLIPTTGHTSLKLSTMSVWAGELDNVAVYDVTAIQASPADVYILAGQSNMVGSNSTPIDASLDTVEPRVTYLEGDGTALQAATDPLQHRGITSHGVGPGMAAARGMLPTLAPGRRIVLVAVARNSTNLVGAGADWEAGVGPEYLNAVSQAQLALSLLPAGSVIKGMFWSQGENDNTATVEVDYPPAFQAMLAAMRSDLGVPAMPCVILGPTPEGDTGGRLAAAQASLDATSGHANATAGVRYSAGPAGMTMTGDDIHFHPAGNRLRGANAAALMAGLV